MKIEQPTFQILQYTPNMTKLIERAGRICWKSEERIEEGSDTKFIEMIKGVNHESVLEHGTISVLFSTDRGVTHELVRHRICSFSQSSTRYCNYSKGKFGGEITVIEPFFFDKDSVQYATWKNSCEEAEFSYLALINAGAKAQEARSVLPNSLKTEIVVTCNVREWRKIFELRTSNAAHPQIRQIMCPLLGLFRKNWNVLFNDVGSIDHPCPAMIVEGDIDYEQDL